MVKNVQLKTILIFAIITTILITGLSVYFLMHLQKIDASLTTQIATQSEEVQDVVSYTKEAIENGRLLFIYAIFAFLLIAIAIAVFVTTKVTKPINKLITSAKKIAAGEEVKIEKSSNGKEDKEINELVDAFRVNDNRVKRKFK